MHSQHRWEEVMPQPQIHSPTSSPSSQRTESRTTSSARSLHITSAAFADGSSIPKRYTADGDDISPPLTWTRGPGATMSFALLCEDPDAPSGTFVHWLLWDIKPDQLELKEAVPATADAYGLRQGENGFGRTGWGGPSPPRGNAPHRYVFRIYALDTKLDLLPGAARVDFDRAISGHVLAEGTLIGMYGR
jgi:Raf kinase inhibitor-like YbhB/YbcL family protein